MGRPRTVYTGHYSYQDRALTNRRGTTGGLT